MHFHISTLLYCFNAQDEVLLMHRAQEPNLGCWSPCGGKVNMAEGESPYAGAQREALEELGVQVDLRDLHLTGLVTERAHEGQAHWLMFLFEVRSRLRKLPPPHREGTFQFFAPAQIPQLTLPTSDREQLWPLFWAHRGGFFAARCTCHPDQRQEWILETSQPAARYA